MNQDRSSVWKIKKKKREIKVIYVEKAGITQVGKVKKLLGNSESVDESFFKLLSPLPNICKSIS